MSGTKVLKCKCESKFQDETYGKGMRLHNLNSDKNKAHCTVCEGSARTAKRKDRKTGELMSSSRPFKNI